MHDVIMYDGQDVKKRPFHPDPYDILEQIIIGARMKALNERRLIREHEPFSIRMKQSWDITMSQKLLQDKFAVVTTCLTN
jgi:mRNA-capping enzyme